MLWPNSVTVPGHVAADKRDSIPEVTEADGMLNEQLEHHGENRDEGLWNYTEAHPVCGGQGGLPGGGDS